MPGLFVDMFFHQYPTKIIGPGQQSQLSGRYTLRKPGTLDVGEIIQHEPGHRNDPHVSGRVGKLFHPSGQRCPARLEGPGDEAGKTRGAILESSQPQEVVDNVFIGFHVTEHHGGSGCKSHAVGGFVNIEPLVGSGLSRCDHLPHRFGKDFGTTSRDGPNSGIP